MPFNRSKREAINERRYLVSQLGPDVDRYERDRQRALSDARRYIEREYGGAYLTVSDFGLRATLESRGPDGYGEAGSIHEGSGDARWWLVMWRPGTGERKLRRKR